MAKVLGYNPMPQQVQWATAGLGQDIQPPVTTTPPTIGTYLFAIVDTASMAASAYHGYKRNNSIGWALWWGFCGTIAPIITPVIAMAQGFGKPARAHPNRSHRRRRVRPNRSDFDRLKDCRSEVHALRQEKRR